MNDGSRTLKSEPESKIDYLKLSLQRFLSFQINWKFITTIGEELITESFLQRHGQEDTKVLPKVSSDRWDWPEQSERDKGPEAIIKTILLCPPPA
ncbi:hypothetical protein CDAR_548071 [Caerostris darwini]|uniref:Uncharacterized protein n=1 Tax=Caerostris darwini TaxID=1538125 RepID=A0AAV4WG43_9ARAC|nr:hypothetical protein CDAR_548071 [Caerostris darwini]